MKISQRIIILILINIFALLGLAAIIIRLSTTEEKYYAQSNRILDFKYTLSEKQNREKLIYRLHQNGVSIELLSFQLSNKFIEMEISGIDENSNLYSEIETLLNKRETLSGVLKNIDSILKNRKYSIESLCDSFQKAADVINYGNEKLLTDQSHMIKQLSSATVKNVKYLTSGSDMQSEEFKNELNILILELKELEEKNSAYSLDQSLLISNDLLNLSAKILESNDEMLRISGEKQITDDRIFLITDKIRNNLLVSLKKREDQKIFTIITGLLSISLFSILTTVLMGRSIVRPIEQLKSYVMSIDFSKSSRRTDGENIKSQINPRKHREIYQLAESYALLEDALFQKMSELEERSDYLSEELLERKKTERKLIKTEKYLNNIIQSLKSMIITADNKLKLIHVNDMAEKSAVGNSNSLYTRFPFLEQYEKEITGVLEKSESFFDHTIIIDSLSDRYFNLSITPLAGDLTAGIVIRLDDVTQIKNIENQLIHTQKWETLGVLTSGFAHDFNNVLAGIVTSSSIILHKVKTDYPDLDKSLMNCLNIIDKSGKRAASMVQQLLSLSKSNDLNFTNVDLNQSVQDIESICRNSFDKSVTIEVELLPEKIPVKADYAQIEQSLLNLCINSYHAMTEMREKGQKIGGDLRISLKKVYADQFSQHENKNYNPGNYITISISDTGVGISRENRKKIYDPFHTTKDKSKGSGLGLTMVQHIIEQHNGFIELYSEPGRGTVFTIFLPVSEIVESENEKKKIHRDLLKGEGTILVIDDEEIIRVLTESILKQCGYKVFTADDGFSGVDLYRKNRNLVELVILDMSMPGISGKETFIEIKQINPEQKILMSSGFTKDDRIQDLMNLGLEDFIQKPFDYIDMSVKVYNIIHS